jgi:hypothetical protein
LKLLKQEALGKFRYQLAKYRLVVENHGARLKHDRLLRNQLEFSLNRAETFVLEMESLDPVKDNNKYDLTVISIQQALDHLLDLMILLTEPFYDPGEDGGN